MPENIYLDAGRDLNAGEFTGRDKHTTTINLQLPSGALSASIRQFVLPNQPYFFGREQELVKIAETLRPESRGWGMLIDGQGGIGKTALAIEAGHRAPQTVFSTKFFLSAKARKLNPEGPKPISDFRLTTYLSILAELARMLDASAILLESSSEWPRAVRRILSDKRALLIIDNVETLLDTDLDGLFEFPDHLPVSCKAIVTSRFRANTFAKAIHLGQLTPNEANALISSLAEQWPQLAQTSAEERLLLYETSGGNPLIIKWLVGQLGRAGSRCYTVTEACRFLQTTPPENDPLEYIFGDVLQTCHPAEIAALCALTFFTGFAQIKWISEITGLTHFTIEGSLRDVTQRALLVADPSLSAFALPPLTSEFLKRAHPQLVNDIGVSLTNYVEKLVRDSHNKSDFRKLADDWPCLAAALPFFLQGDNSRLQDLCDTLTSFFIASGRWDDWLPLNLLAEARARSAKDLVKAGWRAYYASQIYKLQNQPSEVLHCARRAKLYWKDASAREKGIATWMFGQGYKLDKNYRAAAEAYSEVLASWRSFPNTKDLTKDLALVLNELAEVRLALNDLEKSHSTGREAVKIARNAKDPERIMLCVSTLAEIELARQDFQAAEQLASKGLRLAEAIDYQEPQYREVIGRNSCTLANIFVRQGRKTEGRQQAQRAVDIFTSLRSLGLEKAKALLEECREGPAP